MKVLVLAPHPYYVVRGTPIDLDLVLRALSERSGTEVDALVYPAGEDRAYPNVRLHRVPALPGCRNLPPGFTLRKLLLDALMARQAGRLARRNRYDLIHAGEEAAFIARRLGRRLGIPYAYDLDSSIAQQMVEKHPFLRPLAGFFNRREAAAIRDALITLPVCNALADLCRERGARHVVTLHDISQLERPNAPRTGALAQQLGCDGPLVLYVGNLETYQGVDLLLESLAVARRSAPDLELAIVGGTEAKIAFYRGLAAGLEIDGAVHFLGPRPLDELDALLAEADILVSPRIRGVNTPMKVFPYLHSGRPLVATRLPTHTQILDDRVACLADPAPEAFGAALADLAIDEEKRRALGRSGYEFADSEHTWPAYRRRFHEAYDWIERQVG